jgi:uncharacterized protein (DUF58 family)
MECETLWQESAAIATHLPPQSWQAFARLCAQNGSRARQQRGEGQDFWQYRPLSDGESAAQVDWRKSARGEHLLVREREQQSQRRSFLWCDMSGSMHYAGSRAARSKAAHGYLLGAALWHLAAQAGDELKLLGATHILQRDMPQALRDARPMNSHDLREDDLLFVVSDFLGFDFAHQAHSGPIFALYVQDPDEIDFPFTGHIRFEGLEGEAPLIAPNAAALRDDYVAAQAAQLANIRRMSIAMAVCSSAETPLLALQSLIESVNT